VEDIKIRRLGLAGHIIRMEDERFQKRFLLGKVIIQDKWENHLQDGSHPDGNLGIRGWKRRTEDRQE
jgi:hypothetical protein